MCFDSGSVKDLERGVVTLHVVKISVDSHLHNLYFPEFRDRGSSNVFHCGYPMGSVCLV